MDFDHDVVVIGGGIAGITAAQFSARENLNTLVLEELANGGQALLVNDLENYPGFSEPISGIDFAMRLEKQARSFGVQFKSATATKLEKNDTGFIISAGKKTITARGVLLATGSTHKTLGIPGESEYEGKGVSYCGTCDGPFFKNRKILVIGGGDNACEEAEFLSKLTDKLTLIHRGSDFRAQKALSARVKSNPRVSVLLSTICREIRGTDRVRSVVLENAVSGDKTEAQFDGVFIFIGSTPRTELVPDLKKDDYGYLITDETLATEVPGLYAAGDVRSMSFRSLVSGAADGALAAHNLARYLYKEN
ncbi:MAG: FAD-dependent oxidoreductase [Spirochaetales bacterium]|nr:FAD-dependent oxidoreductase [Spirochaetales bacterium]